MAVAPDEEIEASEGPARSETMGGLAKGIAILELFGAGARRLTVADAARGSGATRAAARRCLLTLEELGYVARDGRDFLPLPRLRRLAGPANGHEILANLAQPILNRARDLLKETVSLAVLDGFDAHFIARAEAERIVQTGVRLGVRLPAYSTAAGRLLLGNLADEQLRTLLDAAEPQARTQRSLTDRKALFDAIVAARQEGVSYSDEELELGMRAIAVPVRDGDQIIGAISMSSLTLRLSIDAMERDCRPILERAAADLALATRGGRT